MQILSHIFTIKYLGNVYHISFKSQNGVRGREREDKLIIAHHGKQYDRIKQIAGDKI